MVPIADFVECLTLSDVRIDRREWHVAVTPA
jgi:hypothetical protein